MSKRCMTRHYPKVIEEKEATDLYDYLRDNIKWEDGVRSRSGFTRKAKPLLLNGITSDKRVTNIIEKVMKLLLYDNEYDLLSIYLNYYQDGEMYTPSHSHPKQHQLIISLGTTRTLIVGKKNIKSSNGDAIIFGSSSHSIPKEPEIKEGRISIALFMSPKSTVPTNISGTIQNDSINTADIIQFEDGSIVTDIFTREDYELMERNMKNFRIAWE